MNSVAASRYPAEQYDSCPLEMAGLNYNWSAMTTLVNNMSPNGNTNQGVGLSWGWLTLVGGGVFTVPAKDPKYQYSEVIILFTDGLNTENRWYTNQTSIDDRQKITCANAKAAGIILYTVQVNTGGDTTSQMLKNCASDLEQILHPDVSIRDHLDLQPDRHRALEPAGREIAAAHRTPTQKQSPAGQPGFSFTPDATSLLDRRDLAEVALERLVSLLGEIGIELAELGRFGDKAFI